MIDLRDPVADATSVIAALNLHPHPEGGHYRETWRDSPSDGGRGVGTAILFLLRSGEVRT
jgi:predicted cupin superfamily sugar epimerase